MTFIDAVRSAWRMIAAHRMRAGFTILGTVLGVTFLIAVITLIEGMDRYVQEDFGSVVYGHNTVTVRQRPSVVMSVTGDEWRAWRRRPRLTRPDSDWLAERLDVPATVASSSTIRGSVRGPQGREMENVRIVGASASYFDLRDMPLAEGRTFTTHEERAGLPVLVVGSTVAANLLGGLDAVGREVSIRGFPYRVIGVLEAQGSLFGMSLDDMVVGLGTSALGSGVVNPPGVVDEIAIRVADASLIPSAMAEAEGLMRVRHRLRPGEPNSFEVETAEASLGFWQTFRTIMLVALPGLVSISLVVGAVVIMNIMLVSVTERTREIGLRKSLGARRKDILRQFMVEAGTLSGFGGVIGIGLGIGLAGLVSMISPMPAQVAPWAIVLGLVLGVGVGMISGVYPAWRASRLDPIEALRHEA